MNKYNLELGDYYTILSTGETYKVTKVTDRLVYIIGEVGIEIAFTWHEMNKNLSNGTRKLTKVNKGKIVGYTLLKDTPEHAKGAKFILVTSEEYEDVYYLNGDKFTNYWYYKKDVENKPEWFSPIYEVVKPTEVYVDTLAGKVKVTKYGVKMVTTAEIVSMEYAKFIQSSIAKFHDNTHYNKPGSPYFVSIETFKVGCKTFHINDIPKLEEAIKQVL